MRNGLKGAFNRRNILNGREITHNFRQNSANGYDFRVSAIVWTLENVCTTSCMRNGVKRELDVEMS